MLNGQFYFDPYDPIYRFHFPACPVVPGSVIVDAFTRVIRQSEGHPAHIRAKNFRLQAFVTPGLYDYQMEKHPGRYTCRLMFENTIMAKGWICYDS